MPKDPGSSLTEPDIIINGRELTFAEAMAVRVAIGSFRLSMNHGDMREGLGEQLAANYDHLLARVERMMLALTERV